MLTAQATAQRIGGIERELPLALERAFDPGAVELVARMVVLGDVVVARAYLLESDPSARGAELLARIEALAARDLPWALASLDRYFFNESSARPLLSALQNRLRLLIQIRCLVDSGDFRVSDAGLPKGQFETASVRHGPTFGSAAKSSANLFSQNAWYISNKVAPGAARFTLAELVDLQLACADCFDASNRGDDEAAVRAMFLRALAVRR